MCERPRQRGAVRDLRELAMVALCQLKGAYATWDPFAIITSLR